MKEMWSRVLIFFAAMLFDEIILVYVV